MYIATPGETGALRDLNDCLAEVAERRRDAAEVDIKQRQEAGAPLDDHTDWVGVREVLEGVELIDPAKEPERLRSVLRVAQALMSPPVELPPPFERLPDYEGVSVRLRALTKRQYLEGLRRVQTAGDGLPEADVAGRNLAHLDALGSFVAASVAEIKGLEDDGGPVTMRAPEGGRISELALNLLDANDLLPVLFTVSREYQELGPLARRRFGRRSGSASAAFNAHAVPAPGGHALAVIVPATPPTSQGPAMNPASALGGN